MSSDGMQITIPGEAFVFYHLNGTHRVSVDFDEEEYSSTPIPFGRTAGHGFGSGGGAFGSGGSGGFGGGSGSGQESPTSMTPIAPTERADRSYFHSRGDSVTSDDSAHSGNHSANHSMNISTSRYPPAKSFAHSSQTSVVATSTSPFSKKPSFASIRNAFKSASGKSSETPPVPQIDHHQVYPVLKNPFNRSTSSLAQAPATTFRKGSVTVSPPQFQRPATPASSRAPKSRNHSYAKSQHSHSGSIFQTSENGSDPGHGNPSSPPPVPRMPDAFGGGGFRSETSPPVDFEDKVVMDPRTPSEYALHAVFMRFATSAEVKIDKFLQQPLVCDRFISAMLFWLTKILGSRPTATRIPGSRSGLQIRRALAVSWQNRAEEHKACRRFCDEMAQVSV